MRRSLLGGLLLALLAENWEEAGELNRDRPPLPELLSRLALECDIQPAVHARLESADRFDLVPAPFREELSAALETHEIEWHWVKGHNGHPENERVDQMASERAEQAGRGL